MGAPTRVKQRNLEAILVKSDRKCHMCCSRLQIQIGALFSYFTFVWNFVEMMLFLFVLLDLSFRAVVSSSQSEYTNRDFFLREGYRNVPLYLWAYEAQTNIDSICVLLCVLRMFKYFSINPS